MGVLDGAAGLMQGFATNYITKRPMIILLQQAAIPSSMLISKLLLNAKYKLSQYLRAIIVFGGIIVVVMPGFLPKARDDSTVDPRLQNGSFSPSPSAGDAGDSVGSQISWIAATGSSSLSYMNTRTILKCRNFFLSFFFSFSHIPTWGRVI